MPADFFPTDPDENAASLSNLGEVIFACLDAVEPRTVIEVGAFHGKSTEEMLDWAERSGSRVIAVDPEPHQDLRDLATRRPALELVEQTSHEALRELEPADAVILDGDHNYYTLSEELRLIEERAPGAELPLIVFHDIGWPLARRDAYYVPERIPSEHRQPLARDVYLLAGEPGVADEGMPFACVAAREGGPRNGVLTAVEDFIGERPQLRLAVVPAFFGLGILWHRETSWAGRVEAVLEPWDRNPILERLEANRVRQMVERYRMTRRLGLFADRSERAAGVFRAMLGSSVFGLAERVSRLRQRGAPLFSREQVRKALDELERNR